MLLTDRLTPSFYRSQKSQEILLDFYEKGEEIALLNTGIWQVYRGVVQLSKIDVSGKKIILGWVTSGHVFDNQKDESVIYHAQAMSDVYVRCLTPQYLRIYPQLVTELIAKLSYRLIQTQKLLTIAAIKLVEDRLWELLSMLKEEMGQPVSNGTRLTVRFTHQNIANVIGATRVTVTRVLGEFQTKNWIEFDSDRHIIIKSKK
ncbi:MAG: Crp/Fnr family transcriptional regulator [Cyanobacteria bacterium P01_F01_bin.143]